MAVERGLLNYNDGTVELPVSPEQMAGISAGTEVSVTDAMSEEINYNVMNSREWTRKDPVMDPNKNRKDGYILVHNPNL